MARYIRTQKYEQDCSLITTLNAAIFFGTLKEFDLDSSLYKKYYYDTSNGSLSPEKVEGYIGITSTRIYPDVEKIKEHIKKGGCSEMTTYHLLTGWHSVLLIPSGGDKVLVVDPVVSVLNEKERKKYYVWSAPINIKWLFDLIKSYPHCSIIQCGKIRLFQKLNKVNSQITLF